MIGSGISTGVSISSAYYYYKLANSGSTVGIVLPLSTNEMWAMFWLSILVAVFSLIIFIWSIYALIRCHHHNDGNIEINSVPTVPMCPLPPPPVQRCMLPELAPTCQLPMTHQYPRSRTTMVTTRSI